MGVQDTGEAEVDVVEDLQRLPVGHGPDVSLLAGGRKMVKAGGIEPLPTGKGQVYTTQTLAVQTQRRFSASPRRSNALQLRRAQKGRHFLYTIATLLTPHRVQHVCNGTAMKPSFRRAS